LSPNPGALTAATWSPIFSLQRNGNGFFYFLFDGLECVVHFFAYVAHFLFFRDVWIRVAVASSRATNLHTPISLGNGRYLAKRLRKAVTSKSGEIYSKTLSSTKLLISYLLITRVERASPSTSSATITRGRLA
jgi:hypothetical protein